MNGINRHDVGVLKLCQRLRFVVKNRRDFDNDGIENQLDSCPYVSTPGWDPRISDPINDFDGDGIPGRDDPALESLPTDQKLLWCLVCWFVPLIGPVLWWVIGEKQNPST